MGQKTEGKTKTQNTDRLWVREGRLRAAIETAVQTTMQTNQDRKTGLERESAGGYNLIIEFVDVRGVMRWRVSLFFLLLLLLLFCSLLLLLLWSRSVSVALVQTTKTNGRPKVVTNVTSPSALPSSLPDGIVSQHSTACKYYGWD